MKRGLVLFSLLLILLVSVSFASASIFSDFWNKITGKVSSGVCGNGILETGELCDYQATDSVNNPYGSQCSTNCWVNGVPPYWRGCRGSGAHVCIDHPNVTDQYFIDHPNCIKNPTCAGLFYNCNGIVCPQPTSTTATGTCTDSDGGLNYNVKGNLNFNNLEFYSDFCNNNGQLNETYCVNNAAYSSLLYNCPYGCSNGACLPAPTNNNQTNQTNQTNPTTGTCTDSDGGKNFDVKGTLNFNNANYLDFCITASQLNEVFCINYNTSYSSVLYNCPYGCSNGACLPAPTTTPGTCTDSDGGRNYNVKGSVSGVYTNNQGTTTPYDWPDYCIYNILNEYSCGYGGYGSSGNGGLAQGDQTWTDLYTCPNGCSDGVCLQEDAPGTLGGTEDQTSESEQNQPPPEDSSYQQENPEFGFIDQTFSLIIDFIRSIFRDTTPPIATITAPIANQVLVVDTTSTTLFVTTNEAATCKWSTTDQLYSSMPDTNTMTGAGTSSHSATISGLTNGQNYNYYVRCQDTAGNAMISSVNISFNVANPPVFCGDGIIETGETCDDGNTISGDGCSSTCQKEEGTEQQGWIFTNQYSACGSRIAVTTNGNMSSVKNIMDGSLLTSWIRGRDGNDYIKFDFGCRLLIQNVRIKMYGSPVTLNSDPECEIYVSEDNSNYRHLMNVDVRTETGCPECGNNGFKININEEGRFLKYYCPTRLETNAYYEEIYFETTTNTALIPPQITINEIVPDYLLITDIFNPKFTIIDIDGVDKNSVILKIVDASGNVARQAQLFDDGFHSDLGVNDNIYGELINLNGLVDGTYKINMVASDTKGNVKNLDVYKITILESLDHCLDAIPNQNNRNDLNRINVIFTMIGGNRDVGIYKENAAKVINEGFKSLQPFESEIDKFNFFFVDTIGDIPLDSTSSDPNNPNSMTSKINEMASKCPYGNVKYTMNFIAKENRIGASGRHIFMFDINILNRILNSEQISAFMHEFGHSFGNLGDEYSDINPPPPWSVLDPPPMPNCFAASSVDDCLDNAPWNYLVGKGCGDPNKIDCTSNNDKYDLEVGCFDVCGSASGLYRSINDGLMRGYNNDYGLWNEKLICDQIKKIVGGVGEYCQSLNSTGSSTIVCGNGIIEGTEECDGTNLNEKTCTSFGYTGGALTCTSGCLLNKTLCTTNSSARCGNEIIETGETCDDGNAISGDGCSSTCQKERILDRLKKLRDLLKRLF